MRLGNATPMASFYWLCAKLLNVPGDIDHEALDNIQQCLTKTSLDEIPTMAEIVTAIAGLKDGKAPVGDGIPVEVWKHGGDNLFSRLHQLITNAWEKGSVPQAWKDSADLFKVAQFRAKTKTTRILMRELLFANDSALIAHSAEEMQKIVDAFSDASKKFGLKKNIKKTEVLSNPTL
ncbi:hypothetical protein NP493_207g00008 [Ridgeia piscesae]|uniref:Reverse transcriptase domain-containing protein n=1 Tax=Ridgeia piscesae TaxID=27915 RepID=A0AAD9P147_RIDPI|nr:hypothetical protein NP493_207g00008 [Ridgeia piscesae]